MKAVFVFDSDIVEFGKAVAMITTDEYTTFLARGMIIPLPQKYCTDGDDIEEDSYWQGWNDCIDTITGEKNGEEKLL